MLKRTRGIIKKADIFDIYRSILNYTKIEYKVNLSKIYFALLMIEKMKSGNIGIRGLRIVSR